MFLFFFEGEKIPAIALARYVLKRSLSPMNNMKLQRILYYVQGYFLREFGRPLFPDEIHAWKFGPVVPTVYYKYSWCGSDLLPVEHDVDDGYDIEVECNAQELALINKVVDHMSRLDVKVLNEKTRSETPWLEATMNGEKIRMNAVISVDSMKRFFLFVEQPF